ncbi:MAG: class I SAM-dependent methyltransferase [Vicinamibacterales bacterium]
MNLSASSSDAVLARAIPYRLRARAVSTATGLTLEIGVGSGLNLAAYPESVRHLVGLDPSLAALAVMRRRLESARFQMSAIGGVGETVPIANNVCDTVVTTWTLCLVRSTSTVLGEVRRTLKPDGRFLFLEHGESPNRIWKGLQDLATPMTRRLCGGCRLNRPILSLIEEAGFQIREVQSFSMHRFPLVTAYLGSARLI